jgi:serine-type D-Ala-D-Ala carboxypeptidase (penicillin-binding protein 5/6)
MVRTAWSSVVPGGGSRFGRRTEGVRTEEASVAGESPDRSKQRESSEEPTSGSKVPVPDSGTHERDPRLAMARENGSSSPSEPRGGVDTATRVFSVRELKTTSAEPPTGTAGEEPAGGEPEAGTTDARLPEPGEPEDAAPEAGEPEAGEPENAAPGAGEREDAAPEVDEPGSVAPDAGGPEAGLPDAQELETGETHARVPEARTSGAGVPEDAVPEDAVPEDAVPEDAVPDAGESATGESRARVPEHAVPDGGEPEDAVPVAGGSEDAASGAGEPQDAVPVAGERGVGEPADAAPETGVPGAEVPEARSPEAGAPDAGGPEDAVPTDGAPEDAVPAEAVREGVDSGDEAGGGAAVGGEPAGDARLRAAVAAWVRSGDATDGGEPEGAEKAAEADEDAAAGVKAEAESGADSDAEAEPNADDESAVGSDAEEAPRDAVPETDAGPAVADAEEGPKGPRVDGGESGTGSAGEAEDGKPVDQPTAIFKRPKPQVDQPTTMLKLGGTPKAPKTTEPSEAERTSKFVALKPLDQPPARKPADATAPVPQIGPERTAQQPLPPKPPLDLLAELTNTPPPPQTPVRTIVRRVKIWTPLVLLLAIVFAIAQAMRPLPAPTLALTAESSYQFKGGKLALPWPTEGQGWMDVNGIGTMGSFGKQTPVAIGSVAKTMTSYIILKEHPLKPGAEGPSITVDATAEKEGGYNKQGESTLDTVKENDKLTEKQALSAVMIPSANNIARLLARWDAGSEAAFVKKMNATAKKLGMTHTKYTDPSGLKETTVSTAEDQVKLGNAVVKIPALTTITSAASWNDPTGKNWSNPNTLPYVMGAIGIKTGSTTAAGGNLLFAARREAGGETVTVVGAILGQHKPRILETVNAVSKTALVAAKDALTSAKILKKGDVVGYVDDGLGGHTPIVVTKDVTAVGWSGFKVRLSFDADDVPHTAKAGTQVGTLTVGDGTSGAVKVPVALQKDLTEPGYAAKLKRIG